MTIRKSSTLLDKISNLSIADKTGLISWVVLGALTIVVGSGAIILRQSLKKKESIQVESQLALSDLQYQIKIDQMSFGFKGQTLNSAIIEIAENIRNKSNVPQGLRQEVKEILQQELENRDIEYATLVGLDRRIIVSANANREGQLFDPNGLVTQVLDRGEQVRSTEIVSWSELSRERVEISSDAIEQDALIRYTLTPVKNRNNSRVIGVLISGDIVNGKLPIVEKTATSLSKSQDYSAVYYLQSTGKFKLATSFLETPQTTLEFISLRDESILKKAIAFSGATVTDGTYLENNYYNLAAKSIANNSGKPVAILVYGNLANSSIFWINILAQIIIAGLVLVLTALLIKFLQKAIAQPIKELEEVARDFSEGDINVRANITTNDEIGRLANTFNYLADTINENNEELQQETLRSRILQNIASRLSRTFELEQVLQVVLDDTRDALQCDRTIYFAFDEKWHGTIIAESVEEQWTKTLGMKIYDPCFAKGYAEQYQQGRVSAIANIREAELQDCHIRQLETLDVKANLVTPVFIEAKLAGLLVAHQCSKPRNWQSNELDLVIQIATQMGTAIERANFQKQQKLDREKEQIARENLQQRALELLMEVDPVSRGDLTIRAEVKEDEIGTIADSYNSTIESLRQLVTQVKTAANLVSHTTREKKASVQQLSEGASQQTKEILNAIERISTMADSIQAVANNAKSAANSVQLASETVKAGDEAMNRTVDGFKAIRQTVADTAKKVKRLGESSQKISKVVNLIHNFADQTNLLALNASIEAAHAGEEGRGFAVVAEEVRSLARQSAAATAEIESLVAEIQGETNEVVAAMESGTEQVVEGTKLVDETRSSLDRVARVSSQINQLVKAIAQSTVEQSKDSELVSMSMAEIVAISERTSTEAVEVSDSFQELLRVAEKLSESVSKFKVS